MQTIRAISQTELLLDGDIPQNIIADQGSVCLGFSDGTLIGCSLDQTGYWRFDVTSKKDSIINLIPGVVGASDDEITIQPITPILWCASGNGTLNPDFVQQTVIIS